MERLHVSVRWDRTTGEPHGWCSHRKRSGGGITEPGKIHPLPLQYEGVLVSWNPLERRQARLIELPSLQSGNGAAVGVGTYLKHQPGWRSLRLELEARSERLVPYSLRLGGRWGSRVGNGQPTADRHQIRRSLGAVTRPV